jgi:hypothetical protein
MKKKLELPPEGLSSDHPRFPEYLSQLIAELEEEQRQKREKNVKVS